VTIESPAQRRSPIAGDYEQTGGFATVAPERAGHLCLNLSHSVSWGGIRELPDDLSGDGRWYSSAPIGIGRDEILTRRRRLRDRSGGAGPAREIMQNQADAFLIARKALDPPKPKPNT
jgi:hypothetical protein